MIRTPCMVLACLAAIVASTQAQAPRESEPRPVEGRWVMTLEMSMGTASPEVTITRKGDLLTGTYSGRYGEFPITGLINGGMLTFSFTMGPEDKPVSICFDGEVAPDAQSMQGHATLADLGTATWTAARAPKPVR